MDSNTFNFLSSLYTDPSTGYIGRDALYRKAKLTDPSITRKVIKEFFNSFTNTQIHHPVPKPIYTPIIGNVGFYQMDLIFFPKYKQQNRGYVGALIAININSRYAYGYAFKKKTTNEISDIIQEFIEQAKEDGHPVMVIESDNGSEFINKKVQKLLVENGIVHNTTEPGNHRFLGKIDRFSRTIKSYISKYMSRNNTVKWFDVLDSLLKNYNSTYHTSIDLEPNNVSQEGERSILNKTVNTSKQIKRKANIKIGDVVRVPLSKNKFEKEGQTYSSKIYVVDSIGSSNVAVRDDEGKLSRQRFNINQLLKVPKESVQANTDKIKNAKKQDRIVRNIRKEGLEPNTEPKKYSARKSKLRAYENILI